ncbi:bacillithiol biosynthesis cysteine-adding enzyme BshC [Saonia flava]|uniref:Putative cysteine ligase BshC n=1 Tax=Saonia flava TaxID=523696 RepID=A0A846QU97_9FLAO|nr:bacillithiol biosynthesis cysteine-adding enzyme BshC [Saonia flava]NJB70530.1 bacillithiol biosynthesis cysteine-adding enzyme BshC [Saonia flava]
MEVDCIPFKTTGYFSELICDYINKDERLKPFYNRFPSLENFKGQIKEKESSFSTTSRKILYKSLTVQYQGVKTSESTATHISLLKENNTFTVVTGHQLNLFTGPLYFLFKIISTINLTKELQEAYPKYNFVPIYWMATEDHDYDEINYFNFKGKKLQWNKKVSGAVGKIDTKGLEEVLDAFSNELGTSKNAATLKELFTKAYLKHNSLTDATKYLANELFGQYGLVIVDGDDKELKSQLIPYINKDIFEKVSFDTVTKSISKLKEVSKDYGIQVNPREINYFYLIDGTRERIIEENGNYAVNETDIKFTKNELKKEIENFPERFSPNVIARPLYQEVILPNLCYIGGGGEIAYWLELKEAFKNMGVTFPILLLRNSVLVVTKKQGSKLKNLNLSLEDIFLKQSSFINKKIREVSNIDIDFSSQKDFLKQQFVRMYQIAEETDKSFLGAVKAQEKKQLKGLDALEKRLLKAQKRKLKDHVIRMTEIQNELFPNQSLQERQLNFSEMYLEMGEDLIPNLINTLKPLGQGFMVLRY